jgi:hypothetical protein
LFGIAGGKVKVGCTNGEGMMGESKTDAAASALNRDMHSFVPLFICSAPPT